MDPRHPQHPYARNTASPYSHAPFHAGSNQPSFPPPSSHPQNAQPVYETHQRRTSENNYYGPPPPHAPSYPRDGAPMPNTGHTRHTSTSSIGHGTPVSRNMPPPSSPQQQSQQQPPHSHGYPPPPLSRGPPPALNSSMSFPASRDLPSLSSINRPGSVNSSMSISSMLGGPPTASRETSQPTSQYPAPPPVNNPPTTYPGSMHASPRTATAAPDYGRFRRPQTPEVQRHHELQGPRDHRANSAGSPPRATTLSTPESHRYGTPQYQRNEPNHSMRPLDERHDPHQMRVPNPNSSIPPPRPSSQPTAYNAPAPAPRLYDPGRPDIPPVRQAPYAEREEPYGFRASRPRHEIEAEARRDRERERELREREQMERERREPPRFGDRPGPLSHEAPSYGRQYQPQQQSSAPYNPDHREPPAWARPRHEQPPEQRAPPHVPPPVSTGYEYPRPGASAYGPPVYSPHEDRFPPGAYGQGPPAHAANSGPQYESPQERQRLAAAQQQLQQPVYGSGAGAAPYRPHESPRARSNEEQLQLQRGTYLGVQQEINRKGRNSPFPQAVQGAQGQLNGPAGEPGIKSEFGKMFSGLGSGVGSMATAGALGGAAQTPYSMGAHLRREDLDGSTAQESVEGKIPRTGSRAGGSRRRKLKDEDGKDGDDSSTGRRTPSGRASKRSKGASQLPAGPSRSGISQNPRDVLGANSSPAPLNPTPFKNPGGLQAVPSPTSSEPKVIPHHHHIRHHHHHNHNGPHAHHHHVPKPAPVPMSKPKRTIVSKAVLDAVAHLPRKHKGNCTYEYSLQAGVPPSQDDPKLLNRGYHTTPKPLPIVSGWENCTFTVHVPRLFLEPESREEITSRRCLFGTDIYTDDSDIVAACIHGGWFRGEWPADVDVELLGLTLDTPAEAKAGAVNGNGNTESGDSNANGKSKRKQEVTLTSPPVNGPQPPPANRDLLVTVLILPTLQKYSATTRFGIRSRDWKKHDGVSYMITKIKWVEGSQTAASGKTRRMRLNTASEQEREVEESFIPLLKNGNGHVAEGEHFEESNVRGGAAPLGAISGLGSAWWKEIDDRKAAQSASGPDPESTSVAETEMDTLAAVDANVEPASEPIVKSEEPANGIEPQPEASAAVAVPAEVDPAVAEV